MTTLVAETVIVRPGLVAPSKAQVALGVAAAEPAVSSPVCKPMLPPVPNVVGAHVASVVIGNTTELFQVAVQISCKVVPVLIVVPPVLEVTAALDMV